MSRFTEFFTKNFQVILIVGLCVLCAYLYNENSKLSVRLQQTELSVRYQQLIDATQRVIGQLSFPKQVADMLKQLGYQVQTIPAPTAEQKQ